MKFVSNLFLIIFLSLTLLTVNLFSSAVTGDCVNGWGVKILDNGDICAGYWQNSSRTGWGTYYWKETGGKYVGNWKNNNMDGFGTYYHKNNSIGFMGTWVNGNELISAIDNTKLKATGVLYGNINNGYGFYAWDKGNKYDGIWKNSKKNGIGAYLFPNGEFCVGQFQDNQLNGTGVFSWANGHVYIGDFKAGKREGQGTLYDDNSKILNTGLWKEDKFISGNPVSIISENKGNNPVISNPNNANQNYKDNDYRMGAYTMVLLTFLETEITHTDYGATKTDFNIQKALDNQNNYQIYGLYRDLHISLSVNSLRSKKSEYTVSGKLGTVRINLDIREIFKNTDSAVYSLTGKINSATNIFMMNESFKNGIRQSYNGEIDFNNDKIKPKLLIRSSDDKLNLFTQIGGKLVNLTTFAILGDNGVYTLRLTGYIDKIETELKIEDILNDGSHLHVSGSIK